MQEKKLTDRANEKHRLSVFVDNLFASKIIETMLYR
jgi:hypothetical protein